MENVEWIRKHNLEEQMGDMMRDIMFEDNESPADLANYVLRCYEEAKKISDAAVSLVDDMLIACVGWSLDSITERLKDQNPKKKFNVRLSRIYTADIEVEAGNEDEAVNIALIKEPEAEYYPIMGSMEIDDVWEDD